MSLVSSAIRHYGYAVELLGVVRGSAFFVETAWRYLTRAPKFAVVELRPTDLPHPIHVRPLTSDWSVAVDILVSREYRFPDPTYATRLEALAKDLVARSITPVIVDCGANIGLSAVWFANRFPDATIFAVEPEPGNFTMLERNAAPYPNIVPVLAGVSDRHTRLSLSNDGGSPWSWETAEKPDGEVETVTIADLLARLPRAAPLIVKIDIEGAEVDLFRSNTEWAKATPLVVFEDHDWLFPGRGTFQAVMKDLVATPRDYFRVGENTFAFAHALVSPAAGASA